MLRALAVRLDFVVLCAGATLAACSPAASQEGLTDSGTSVDTPMGEAGTFAACNFPDDCASGACQTFDGGGYCSRACSKDADCPSAGICDNGSCAPLCSATAVCRGECACAAGLVCTIGKGCAAPAEVGMPCARDQECKSENCSARARVCDQPIGSPCTDASHCEVCWMWTNKSYCSRVCYSNGDCTGYGGVCSAAYGTFGYCNPQCGNQFDSVVCGPLRCDGIEDTSTMTTSWYCSCDPGTSTSLCNVAFEKGAFGASCETDDECQSGDCVELGVNNAGICAETCASDSDCPTGAACVVCGAPASDAGSDAGDAGGAGCGNQCFPLCNDDGGSSCTVGTCRSGARVAGGSVSFCDPHLALGDVCSKGSDCASGRCSVGYGSSNNPGCIPAGGLPSGAACTSNQADCASGGCCNGNCC